MPPSAAPEWLRVGGSLEITPTFAPASYASIAARMPAQPAPTTSTSCVASTCADASGSAGPVALSGAARSGGPDRLVDVGEAAVEVVREHGRQLPRLLV